MSCDLSDRTAVLAMRLLSHFSVARAAHATQAMEEWFDHYDTSVPHRGALFAEDTDDASLRTSSIKDKPVKVAFNQFQYSSWNGMVGEVPVLK